ncbi:MAG: GntR family transcriptional regulator [Pelagibacterium sp. SCN 63-23]|nr:MAG: GntR family transcriptional regulator [Pelagibacterium sp. SCN 63-23]
MSETMESANSQVRMRRSTTAEQIKHLILHRGLRPGDAIPTETELCQALGVSRSSVREAVRTLATLDIVEVRHGHGTVVGNMSLAPLVEALVFRGVLSPGDDLEALREVIELRRALDLAFTDAVVAAHKGKSNPVLESLVSQMAESAEQERPFLSEDRLFHSELLDPIGNPLAVQLVAAFWDIHTAVLPRLGLALPSDLRQTANAHGDLYRSAQRGDAAGYRSAVLDHYEPLLRMLSKTTKG